MERIALQAKSNTPLAHKGDMQNEGMIHSFLTLAKTLNFTDAARQLFFSTGAKQADFKAGAGVGLYAVSEESERGGSHAGRDDLS